MRQYTIKEFPTAKTLTGQPIATPSDILPNGTVISMILEARTPDPPTGFALWSTNHFLFSDFDPPIQPPATTTGYSEEAFFQILSYEPAPRDRYHVERVPGPLGTGTRVFHPQDRGGGVTLHGVTLNRALYEALLEEEVYNEQRQLRGAKGKLKSKLATGDISHEEYATELAAAKKAYAQAKQAAVDQLGFAVGKQATIKNAWLTVEGKQHTSQESRFLKLGDRITAKRKNVRYVVPKKSPGGTMRMATAAIWSSNEEPGIHTGDLPALTFSRARYLTTWSGTLLDREEALKLIGPGNVARVATKEVGAVYFALMGIDRLLQTGFGVLLDTYLLMDDQLARVGEYWQFPLSCCIEVPESWQENANIEKALLQLKQEKGLPITGMTAVDDCCS